jgi:hypothetical protein
MYELLSTIVAAYPGWSLFVLFLLAGAAIEAVPATARALRSRKEE